MTSEKPGNSASTNRQYRHVGQPANIRVPATASGLVCQAQAETALAKPAGTLPDLGFGDHAPADAGSNGPPVLRAFHGTLSRHTNAGKVNGKGGPAAVAGTGVYPKGEDLVAAARKIR